MAKIIIHNHTTDKSIQQLHETSLRQQTAINNIQATLKTQQQDIIHIKTAIVDIRSSINHIIHSVSEIATKLGFEITLPALLPLSPTSPNPFPVAATTLTITSSPVDRTKHSAATPALNSASTLPYAAGSDKTTAATTGTNTLTLPSNLERRFSSIETKSATKLLNEALHLGVSGFKQVCIGVKDDESMKVAIKRGSSISNETYPEVYFFGTGPFEVLRVRQTSYPKLLKSQVWTDELTESKLFGFMLERCQEKIIAKVFFIFDPGGIYHGEEHTWILALNSYAYKLYEVMLGTHNQAWFAPMLDENGRNFLSFKKIVSIFHPGGDAFNEIVFFQIWPKYNVANAYFSLSALGNILDRTNESYSGRYNIMPFSIIEACSANFTNLKSIVFLINIFRLTFSTFIIILSSAKIPFTLTFGETKLSHRPKEGFLVHEMGVLTNLALPIGIILIVAAWIEWFQCIKFDTDCKDREIDSRNISGKENYHSKVRLRSFALMLHSLVLSFTSVCFNIKPSFSKTQGSAIIIDNNFHFPKLLPTIAYSQNLDESKPLIFDPGGKIDLECLFVVRLITWRCYTQS